MSEELEAIIIISVLFGFLFFGIYAFIKAMRNG
jgi:hypothetical protein